MSRDRPKPDQGHQLDVPDTVEGTTEAEPLVVNERSGPTGGTAEAEPGVEARRSRSSVRSRPDGGPRSPCLGACEGRQAPAPSGAVTTSLPRGGGRSRVPHRRVPRQNARGRAGVAGTRAASFHRRSDNRAVAKGPARERRYQTLGGLCEHNPWRVVGTSSRASACHPVQQPDPRAGKVRGRNQAQPVHEPGRRRTGTRGNAGNAEAFLAIIAFYPTLRIGSLREPFAPRDCFSGTALAPIYNLCSAFHVEPHHGLIGKSYKPRRQTGLPIRFRSCPEPKG